MAVVLAVPLLSGCTPTRVYNSLLGGSGYELRTDLVFGSQPRQKLDVYIPVKQLENAQTVVFVYGGAWRRGSRESYRFVAHRLANAGHRVIVPDYQLYPQVQFPTFVQDVADAIVWVHDNPDASGIASGDMNAIVLMGHSSGAHTASLLAANPAWLSDSPVNVTALIGISGPYKLPLDIPEVASAFPLQQSDPEALPLEQISASHPRTLLIHGSDDERVLPMHSQVYFDTLRSQSIKAEIHWLEGAGHIAAIASMAPPLGFLNDTGEAVDEFLGTLTQP